MPVTITFAKVICEGFQLWWLAGSHNCITVWEQVEALAGPQMSVPHSEQVPPEESDAVATEPTFSDLPADYISLLSDVLPLRDLVAASCTCKHWHRCCDRVWESRCHSRWRYWCNAPPSSSTEPRAWREVYKQRHQRDQSIFQLLTDACWPDRAAAAYSSLMDMGVDALDALAAAAHSSCASSMLVGVAYHARVALHYVVGETCAQQLKQLLQQRGEEENMGVAAASNDVLVALDGALLLAQALHPLSDVAAVRQLVRQLGQELRARMDRAQAQPGSKQAVELLNKLMFGPVAPEAASATAGTSEHHNEGSATGYTPAGSGNVAEPGNSSSTLASSCGNDGGLPCSWWLRDPELDGPDLSRLAVPHDSSAGMGIKGNTTAYYDGNNSCLDAVVATRCGLPITVALLHAAVAAEAGLVVQMVNVPGHVINRAWLSRLDGKAGAGGHRAAAGVASTAPQQQQQQQQQRQDKNSPGGDAEAGSWLYIDAFDGGRELSDAEVRLLAVRFAPPLLAEYLAELDTHAMRPSLLQPLTAPLCMRRMLLNLINSLKQGYAACLGRDEGGLGTQKTPVHLLQLRTIPVALLTLELLPGITTDTRELFDVFGQLGQLIGLEQGKYSDPPAAELLMRKLAAALPAAMQSWKVKIEAGLEGNAQQRQSHRQQVHLRSQHPRVQHFIGEMVEFRQAGQPAARKSVVAGWSTVKPSRAIRSGVAHQDELRVLYTLLVEGVHMGLLTQAQHEEMTTLWADNATADNQVGAAASYHAQVQAGMEEQQRQLRCLQHCWYERAFPACLLHGADGDSEQQQLHGWEERHTALGSLFDAVLAGGLCMPNVCVRAMFPEG